MVGKATMFLKSGFLIYQHDNMTLRVPWRLSGVYPVGINDVSVGHIQLQLSNGDVDGFAINKFLKSLKLLEQNTKIETEFINEHK